MNEVDKNRQTPLHLAASWGYIDIVKKFIDKGAYRFLKDKDGRTPEQEAAENDHEAVRSLLENYKPGKSSYV